jgi:hypothetical protein
MRTPINSLPSIRAAVLCDHPVLCEAIEVGLRHRFGIEIVSAPSDTGQMTRLANRLDLMVLVVLSSDEDRPSALQEVLSGRAPSHIPLLVISEHPVELSGYVEMTVCLGFPFQYDDLYDAVAEILANEGVLDREVVQ